MLERRRDLESDPGRELLIHSHYTVFAIDYSRELDFGLDMKRPRSRNIRTW